MTTMPQRLPKRLIEVDLSIKRISAHARREKSIRHGHISTLHIWWARRPLAACRAVLCAALWPDPADELCPEQFRKAARKIMKQWAGENLGLCSAESYHRFHGINKNPQELNTTSCSATLCSTSSPTLQIGRIPVMAYARASGQSRFSVQNRNIGVSCASGLDEQGECHICI